jgi:hypothetical protein
MAGTESSPSAQNFIRIIDGKFGFLYTKPGIYQRQHEEGVALAPVPSDELGIIRPVHVEADRPKFDDKEDVAKVWDTFGGHRITTVDDKGKQIDFYIKDGTLQRRERPYLPDYLTTAERNEDRYREHDYTLRLETIEVLLSWAGELAVVTR